MQLEQDRRPHVAAGAELDAFADVVAKLEGKTGALERTRAACALDVVARAWALRGRDAEAFGALCSRMKALGVLMSVWERDVRVCVPAPPVEPVAPSPGQGWRSPAPLAPLDDGPPLAVEPSTGAGQVEPDGASAADALDALDTPRPYTSARFDDPDDESPEAEAERDRQRAELEGSEARSRVEGRERIRGILEGRDRKAARMTPTRGPGGLGSLGVPGFVAGVLCAVAEGREPDAGELARALEALAPGAAPERETAAPVEPAPVSWAAELGIVERTGADAAADAREAMREAAREGAPDPLDGLPERITSESNPALAFDAPVIGELCTMAEGEPAAYQSERAKLRAAGVSVTALDKAVEAERQRRKRAAKEAEREGLARAEALRREAVTAEHAEAVARVEGSDLAAHAGETTVNNVRYFAAVGEMYMVDTSRARTSLASFSALIVAEVAEYAAPDAAPRRLYRLSVVLGTEKHARTIDVPAAEFASLAWVATELGGAANIRGGRDVKEHLRIAIQELSRARMERHDRYAFTGWLRHGGQWVYLHAGGAIGAEGAVEGVDVAIEPACNARLHRLPSPPEAEDRWQAARLLVEMMRVDSPAALPMLGLVFRAAMGPCRVTMMLVGPKGGGKTWLAEIYMSLQGADLAAAPTAQLNEPRTTLRGIIKTASRLGDGVLFADDLQREEAVMAKGRAVVEAVYNRGTPQRLEANGEFQRAEAARCAALITAEAGMQVHSASSRVVTIEYHQRPPQDLTTLRAKAESGEVAGILAAFVQWYAPRVQSERAELAALDARTAAAWGLGAGTREAGLLGALAVGFETALTFTLEAGALDAAEAQALRAKARRVLGATLAEHVDHVEDEGPVRRILATLRGLLAQGGPLGSYIAVREGNDVLAEPPSSHAGSLGWHPEASYTTSVVAGEHAPVADVVTRWKPHGTCVGYMRRGGDEVGVMPTVVMRAVREVLKRDGHPLPTDDRVAGVELARAGVVVRASTAGPKRARRDFPGTSRMRFGEGVRVPLWVIPIAVLLDTVADPADDASDPSDASAEA